MAKCSQNIEEGRSVHRLYREYPISVLGFAQLSEVTAVEALQHLAEQGDLPVRCFIGSQDEFNAGPRAFCEAGVVVIDPASVATLFLTGFFRSLPPLEPPLITSEGTVQEYRDLLDKSPRGDAFATKHRGRHVVISRDPADHERFRVGVEEFISWLGARARIEGGAELARLGREVRDHAIGEFGQPAAECLAIAIREGAVLWTDDLVLAGYSAARHNLRRTWTQAAGIYLQAAGRLDKNTLDTLTLGLVQYGFAYTRVPADVVLLAARRSGWDDSDGPFRAVTRWIGSDQHSRIGAVEIVATALPLIWRHAPLQQQRQSSTLALLHCLLRRPGGTRHATLLLSRLTASFGLDVVNAGRCSQYISDVLSGQGPDRLIISA